MNLSKELEAIFYQALELAEEERRLFLQVACGDNHRLREDIANLLDSVEKGKVFFDKLPERILNLEFSRPHTANIPCTDKIGPWQLCELLGRGGMGSVYLAERADFQYARQVAIKVLPAGEDNPIARYRFRSEQQILSQLNHQNIARFIDGGVSEEGVRYIVMDYVKGEPLNIYCKKYALTIRDKLTLFQQICRAVHYAHQHNVVHRDLKPANILVTEQGEVKLLDFGIAKILDQDNPQSELTQVVARPLTMAYASPEMVNGETVDKTTDVYSLGIILYELIAGKKPFRTDTTIKQFYDDQHTGLIKKPCQHIHKKLLGALPRKDLDTIVLKALNSKRSLRYTNVHALLGDIELILAGHPIKARPYNALYYLNRFALRHKAASVSALAIFLVLSCASIFSFLQMREAQTQRDLANQQQRHVQATNDFLNLLLEEIGPNGKAMTLEQLLKRGQNMLEQQAATQHQPVYMGRVMLELAQGFGAIGNLEESHKLLERSEEFARIHKDNDLLSIVLCSYTENYISLNFELVEEKYREAKAVQRRLLSPSIDSEIVCDKAQAMILEKTGQAKQALNVLDRGIKKLQETHPGSSNLLLQLLSLKTHALYSLGKQEELLETNSDLLDLYRQSGRKSTASYLITLQNQAILLDMMGELTASAELSKQIVEQFSAADNHLQVPANLLARHADSLYRLGHVKDAIEIYYRSLKSAQHKGDVLWVAQNQARLGRAWLALDEYKKAEAWFALAETRFLQSPETNNRRLHSIARSRATLSRKQGALDKALDTIQTLLVAEGYPTIKYGFGLSQSLYEAAQIALAKKDAELASTYIEDLLQISRALARKESHSADVGNALTLKGELYRLLDQPEQAKLYFHRAAETLFISAGEAHPATRHARRQLLSINGMEMAKN